MNKYKELFDEYTKEIMEWYTIRTDSRERAEQIVERSVELLTHLRFTFEKTGFQNLTEEIHFFKVIKPQAVGQRIANSILLELLFRKSRMSPEDFEKLRAEKILQVKSYFCDFQEFYMYVNSNSTFRDEHYFTIGATKNDLILKILPDLDRAFSTGYDMILAYMYAYDILHERAETLQENEFKPIPQLQWSLPKYDLVELILALHHMKAFNHGKSDLKETAIALGNIFNMNLNDINRASFSIKNRKKENVKFLHELAGNLNRIISDTNR